MAVTVANCMTQLYRPFPDMAAAGAGSTTIAEEYLSEADRMISFHLPIRLATEDINLVAGTSEYATADELISRIWTVRYLRNSSDSFVLDHTDITKLDLEYGDWRGLDNGEPRAFYLGASSVGALRVGLTPAPDQTTSGGYPILRLNTSRTVTLASGDSLPANIRTSKIYVSCACWRYAEDYRMVQEAAMYKARFLQDLNDERDYFFGRNFYDKQEFIYGNFPSSGLV